MAINQHSSLIMNLADGFDDTQEDEQNEGLCNDDEESPGPPVSFTTYYRYFKSGINVFFLVCLLFLFVATQGKHFSYFYVCILYVLHHSFLMQLFFTKKSLTDNLFTTRSAHRMWTGSKTVVFARNF